MDKGFVGHWRQNQSAYHASSTSLPPVPAARALAEVAGRMLDGQGVKLNTLVGKVPVVNDATLADWAEDSWTLATSGTVPGNARTTSCRRRSSTGSSPSRPHWSRNAHRTNRPRRHPDHRDRRRRCGAAAFGRRRHRAAVRRRRRAPAAAETAGEPVAGARLLSPIDPTSVRDFSVFEQHGEGATMAIAGPDAKINPAWYEAPAFYFSNPHATTGPYDEIAPPAGTTGLDLELEVAAIVVGRGRNVGVEEAARLIGGYTIFNDWSERDIAMREARMPFGFHKTKDFANTFGPWIVTPDELEPYRRGDRLDLRLTAYVNGTELGSDTLASMAWSFEELVHFAARGAWVGPGDVIGSGTCGGGCLFELWGRNQAKEPRPLQPGDEVRLEVEGIGVLSNTIGAPHPDLGMLPPARPRASA